VVWPQIGVELTPHSDVPQNIYIGFLWWTKHCMFAM